MIKDIKRFVDYFQQSHKLPLTPAGVWRMEDITETRGKSTHIIGSKKQSIDAKRVDYLDWDNSKYTNDNMARLFVEKEQRLLILDIDASPIVFNPDDKTITIIDLDITIPYGLYTTTTADNKFHFYYRISAEQQDHLANRIKGLHNTTIDIFTYGTVFEGHTFSEANNLHEGAIIDIPQPLLDDVLSWQNEKDLAITDNTILALTPNLQRFNLVKKFLDSELSTTKEWNAFFRMVMPLEYKPANKKKLDIKHYKLSYDIVNKIAVKLATTSELDYHGHMLPTIYKLLEMWGINPVSAITQKQLGMILPSLPKHESIKGYNFSEDVEDLEVLLNAQKGTDSPLFRVINGSKLMFMELDKAAVTPVEHQGSFFLDKATAQTLHPERNIENEEGRIVWWCDQVPVLYYYNKPYKPAYMWDDETNRHYINLYTPTEYIKQAEIVKTIPPNNLINKVVKSTIDPKYLELYLAYSAQILFGKESPTLVLWMAALKTELGGSGKSVVTLELFSLMLGSAASAVDAKTISSGWGDIVTSTKILSLEDMPNLTHKDWEMVYANIKQQNTNSYRKLNMKGAAVTSERVSIAITGSTNYRPKLSSSDRRFLCLEPAHFHGITEPLNREDRIALARVLSSHEYEQEVQEYVNYLYYIFSQGLTEEMSEAIFIEAPQTEYRRKWIDGGESNTQNILHNMSHPEDLVAQCKHDEMSASLLADLLSMILVSYNPSSQKSAVSWKWFEDMLPYVQSDNYKDTHYSKAQIQKMLHIDFKNVGQIHFNKWRLETPLDFPPEWSRWPTEGYVFSLTVEGYKSYRKVIAELKGI